MQSSGNTMEFNVAQVCAAPVGAPEDENMDRMLQFSLGLQVPLYSETSSLRSYKCMPIESELVGAQLFKEILDERPTQTLFTALRSTGVCVAAMNPRKRLADGSIEHTVTWGYGGFQRMKYYWQGLDVNAGDYVGYAIRIRFTDQTYRTIHTCVDGVTPCVYKEALVFKQTKGVCNRGLTRTEPKSWINVYLQHYVVKSENDILDKDNHENETHLRYPVGFVGHAGECKLAAHTLVYIVSVGQITETLRCDAYERPISKEIPKASQLLKTGPQKPVAVIVNMQDMWFGPAFGIMSPDSTVPLFTHHNYGRAGTYTDVEVNQSIAVYGRRPAAKKRATEELGDFMPMDESYIDMDHTVNGVLMPTNTIPPTLVDGRSVFRFDAGVPVVIVGRVMPAVFGGSSKVVAAGNLGTPTGPPRPLLTDTDIDTICGMVESNSSGTYGITPAIITAAIVGFNTTHTISTAQAGILDALYCLSVKATRLIAAGLTYQGSAIPAIATSLTSTYFSDVASAISQITTNYDTRITASSNVVLQSVITRAAFSLVRTVDLFRDTLNLIIGKTERLASLCFNMDLSEKSATTVYANAIPSTVFDILRNATTYPVVDQKSIHRVDMYRSIGGYYTAKNITLTTASALTGLIMAIETSNTIALVGNTVFASVRQFIVDARTYIGAMGVATVAQSITDMLAIVTSALRITADIDRIIVACPTMPSLTAIRNQKNSANVNIATETGIVNAATVTPVDAAAACTRANLEIIELQRTYTLATTEEHTINTAAAAVAAAAVAAAAAAVAAAQSIAQSIAAARASQVQIQASAKTVHDQLLVHSTNTVIQQYVVDVDNVALLVMAQLALATAAAAASPPDVLNATNAATEAARLAQLAKGAADDAVAEVARAASMSTMTVAAGNALAAEQTRRSAHGYMPVNFSREGTPANLLDAYNTFYKAKFGKGPNTYIRVSKGTDVVPTICRSSNIVAGLDFLYSIQAIRPTSHAAPDTGFQRVRFNGNWYEIDSRFCRIKSDYTPTHCDTEQEFVDLTRYGGIALTTEQSNWFNSAENTSMTTLRPPIPFESGGPIALIYPTTNTTAGAYV